ncbi:pirin family protein [Stenotrophomonas maltophilia]|uniref:pirin family protein n=1 Tax=Stenotrophomonas maltophilia TaxID=40324 RepID=UPI001076BC58|nr:pirin family protein [Stenotrophomonas maltophilia]TFZ45602.1 pirin family protein [Stenotrophomonas maltophilia]
MSSVVLNVASLSRPWRGNDPFLFCAHHIDHYPPADGAMGVPARFLDLDSMADARPPKQAFRMYHGTRIPGFPRHPHRGFETITYVRQGLVDHADSMGGSARYGAGDVQWLTAGQGVAHSEMFPLADDDQGNTLELFQIWLNLPAADKMAAPGFSIFWSEQIPVWRGAATHGSTTVNEVIVIAGEFQPAQGSALKPPRPPRASWASAVTNEVALWLIRLSPGQSIEIPAARYSGTRRSLYVFAGSSLSIDGAAYPTQTQIEVRATRSFVAANSGQTLLEILLMQGQPIAEPVVASGPFVMNDEAGLRQAHADFSATQFGGWPWREDGPVHPKAAGRFSLRAPAASTEAERDCPVPSDTPST